MKQVLFLCTANYYRSRFAEHLFNWLAPQAGLRWSADSRALDPGPWDNIGAISRYAVEGLRSLGVPLDAAPRRPRPLALADLACADLVIAVKEAEHRSLMARQFPLWTERVEYWHIDDLDCADPCEAIPALEAKVRDLIERLGAEQVGCVSA
jgi:protein-tyrosine phosphatase